MTGAADQPYRVPSRARRIETVIKRSRFITSVAAATNRDEAMAFIASVRATYPDANHHCWAYVCGRPGDMHSAHKSDDGEPKGSAGKPMLNVLAHADIGHVVAVVTRYFGGVKLGVGGLVRAYSQCVNDALREIETDVYFETCEIEVEVPYSLLDKLEHSLAGGKTRIVERRFEAGVTLRLCVPLCDADAIDTLLADIGQGTIRQRLITNAPD